MDLLFDESMKIENSLWSFAKDLQLKFDTCTISVLLFPSRCGLHSY
jgi:hypothetical protein